MPANKERLPGGAGHPERQSSFSLEGPMQYLHFTSSESMEPHIMADAASGASTVFELSHWPGNRTPPSYRADTSTESVIRYLRDVDAVRPAVSKVSCDHYDVDGLLSVWSLIHQEHALERATDLVAAATAGDFDLYSTERGVQICLALVAVEEVEVQPLMRPSVWGTEGTTGFLFDHLLPRVAAIVDRPDVHEALWSDEFEAVQRSREMIRSGAVEIFERPDLDLAWVRSAELLHPFALHEATDRHRILESWGDSTHRVRYRYESFVELRSRSVEPRVPLEGLARELASIEQCTGTWFAEPVDSAHPALQLYEPAGSPGLSSIGFQRMLEVVVSYLEASASHEGSWSPYPAWHTSARVLPPSLDRPAHA